MQPVLLSYNLTGEKANKVRFICMMLKVRFKEVAADAAELAVGDLAGVKDLGAPEGAQEPVTDEMLVMCHFNEQLFDRFLNSLRAGGIPPIPLKAVLTPTNAKWTSFALCEELKREREEVRKQLQKK